MRSIPKPLKYSLLQCIAGTTGKMEVTLSSGVEDIVVFAHTLGSLPAIKAIPITVDRK